MTAKKGELKVSLQDENGMILTKEYGFIVEESDGSLPTAFDFFFHPEYGNILLINNEVMFLKFWKSDDIRKLRKLVVDTTDKELGRRNESASLSS